MPLTTNPYISSTITSPTPSSTTGGNSLVSYSSSLDASKQALSATINALSGGLGSGLNGASTPVSKARGTNTLNQLVQNSVNLQAGTLVDSLTQSTTKQLATTEQAIIETIASGTPSADAISSLFNTAKGNIIEAARSANLPKVDINALLTEEANNFNWGDPETIVRAAPIEPGDWRVRIYAPLGKGTIIFPVLPTLTLAHRANYKEEGLVHTNYQFLSYKASQPEDIQITCEWPVETPEDAEDWLQTMLLGRSLTKMFYGSGEHLGNPPLICTLRGYSGVAGGGNILPDIPVVIKAFSIELRDDVNYVNYQDNFVPRLSTVSVTCSVIYNRNSQRSFNWQEFRNGAGTMRY